uniref:Uncharacterized protein n=1 Tax=Nelumbo nucifera TaxID=4432 RepID=A0A822Y6M1_NELNU|nr:TPA_asm: hypothetical protein HUJ06_029618 [Nelumbo nucifera]
MQHARTWGRMLPDCSGETLVALVSEIVALSAPGSNTPVLCILNHLQPLVCPPHGNDSLIRRGRQSSGYVLRCRIMEPSGEPAPLGQKMQYRDVFLEKTFMALFAQKVEK